MSDGHYLYDTNMDSVLHWRKATPWEQIDAQLAPTTKPYQVEGATALHHKDGWTAIQFWDRSGDSRGNSNSAFLMEGTWAFEEALAKAREAFPNIFKRFKFEIRLYDEMRERQMKEMESRQRAAKNFELGSHS